VARFAFLDVSQDAVCPVHAARVGALESNRRAHEHVAAIALATVCRRGWRPNHSLKPTRLRLPA